MPATKELIKAAREASSHAYVPYSNFPVGAALVTTDGKVYQGCNIENASFGLSNCAERTAIFKAVSEDHLEFSSLYIYGETAAPISPCGACRQVVSEFCNADMPVYLLSKTGEVKETSVGQLLPYSFKELE
ncbi:cytidine deaminase [Lactococcus formosensis]|jgi:cytidine deaminase, homotetrameric|uniref:Cytidine deaminase n=2 Tax=cellular organisms TaxID=131567 RepID=A0A9Q9D5X2_9LACT|nr:cytidine deaminase [Lactococcus formosensis]MCH1722078.1 cytidine deaminase [Lactococcus formosensis]MDG6110964.1 cytidine deaminase [Lactococcus formosensis]MDG6113803.1 cytidine deaminase [Lactococcus formosensis]MDG6115784.1 cytidine deaminase [Lactococcus formosensis]MDG6117428.1 cytidine deaminase [Lactococcus formosensis]